MCSCNALRQMQGEIFLNKKEWFYQANGNINSVSRYSSSFCRQAMYIPWALKGQSKRSPVIPNFHWFEGKRSALIVAAVSAGLNSYQIWWFYRACTILAGALRGFCACWQNRKSNFVNTQWLHFAKLSHSRRLWVLTFLKNSAFKIHFMQQGVLCCCLHISISSGPGVWRHISQRWIYTRNTCIHLLLTKG